jgi:peptidylprolyl isomerase
LLDITRGPKPPADFAAAPPDAEVTKDGLASKVTKKGTGGVHPLPSDAVRVNDSIWRTTDGKLIDEFSDKVRGVTSFSPWWTEGLQQMVVGEKRTFWVPATLGFAEHPGDTVTPTTMVIELLEILPPPAAPPDVHGPPEDATTEQDGLATKVIERGTGTVHPNAKDVVTVKYTGWTIDGKMFESTYSRGKPATLSIDAIVPGWTEALQLMVEGEKRRMWIPSALAYNGEARRPQGNIVFDVELIKIGGAQ